MQVISKLESKVINVFQWGIHKLMSVLLSIFERNIYISSEIIHKDAESASIQNIQGFSILKMLDLILGLKKSMTINVVF